MDHKIKELQDRIAQAHLGGGEKRIEKQHQKKKLTARERVLYFLDEGSFEEMGILVTHRTTDFGMDKEMYYGDGVVTGYGNRKWTVGICVRPRFYRFRGSTFRNPRRKNL